MGERERNTRSVGERAAPTPAKDAAPAPPVTERLHYYAGELEGITSRLVNESERLGGKYEPQATLADSDGTLDAAVARYQCAVNVLTQVAAKLETL